MPREVVSRLPGLPAFVMLDWINAAPDDKPGLALTARDQLSGADEYSTSLIGHVNNYSSQAQRVGPSQSCQQSGAVIGLAYAAPSRRAIGERAGGSIGEEIEPEVNHVCQPRAPSVRPRSSSIFLISGAIRGHFLNLNLEILNTAILSIASGLCSRLRLRRRPRQNSSFRPNS